MTERERSASTTGHQFSSCKMENGMGPRKTTVIIVIVVGCFAVLWPKVFYPMLVGSANQLIQPSSIDKTTGCCDVISEIDVNNIKIMNELCGTIVPTVEDGKPLGAKEVVRRCQQEILETCGMDIAAVLQDQVRLGRNVKQILDEIRSLNGSLCLKYNYGLAPWRLGVPHRVTVKVSSDSNIRQERPLHLRSELIHPAFRERGRAIPQTQSQASAPPRPPPRVVEGRPGPVPGMRPTIGGAGHVVPPSKQGTSSMSVIMPIYTIGIVIFFTYTLMKVVFRKQPEGVGGALYPPVEPDPIFRKEVFESEKSRLAPRLSRESISTKLGDAELDQLRQRLRETELAMERIVEQMAKVPLKAQDLANGTLSNGDVLKSQDNENIKPHDNDDQPTVKVLGMEMTASCEGGKKWSRPESPVLPTTPLPSVEPVPPPQEIYLEGALPAQSHLLVSDSATESQTNPGDAGEDPAVVLAGKMTLSVISLDASDKGAEEEADVKLEEADLGSELENEIQEILRKYQSNEESEAQTVVEDIEKVIEEPIEKVIEAVEEPSVEPVIQLKEKLENIESVLKESVIEPLFGEKIEIDDLDPVVESKEEIKVISSAESIQPVSEFKEAIKEATAEAKTDTIPKEETEEIIAEFARETNETPLVKLREEIEEIIDVVKDDAMRPEIKKVIDVESEVVPVAEDKEEIRKSAEDDATPKRPVVAFKELNEPSVKFKEPELIIDDEEEEEEEIEEIEVEEVERAVDDLIQEAIENITQSTPTSGHVTETPPTSLGSDREVVPNPPAPSEREISNEEEVEAGESSDEEVEVESEEEVEIVYESSEEESEEEENNANHTEPSPVGRVNGQSLLEESKYNTVSSSATAAENDISDEEVTDNEEVDEDEEEIIEIEEEEEEANNVNHLSGESESED